MSFHLAESLPAHPVMRHPLTGAPVRALGVSKSGRLIWPVMGGSQPTGAPNPAPTPPPVPVPVPAPPVVPAVVPPAPGPLGLPGNGDHGYPENTPVAQMSAEQQAAYWRHYARRNEDRLKQMGDYAQLKEQAEAYQRYLQESQTEQQKALVEAEQRGRKAALAEAGGHMVEAYVRAAATGRMSEEQVSTLLQGLDRNRFVNPGTGAVDAQMVQAYVAMLAPAPVTYPPQALVPPVPGAPGVPVAPVTYPPGVWPGYPPAPAQAPVQPDMGANRQVPSYGQAQYPMPQPRGLEAGRAVAAARFGKKPA